MKTRSILLVLVTISTMIKGMDDDELQFHMELFDNNSQISFYERLKNATEEYQANTVKILLSRFQQDSSSLTDKEISSLIRTNKQNSEKVDALKKTMSENIKNHFEQVLTNAQTTTKTTFKTDGNNFVSQQEAIFKITAKNNLEKLLQQYQEIERKCSNAFAMQLLFESNFEEF